MEVGHKEIGDLVICDTCGVFEMVPRASQKAIVETLLDLDDQSIDEFFSLAGLRFGNKKGREGRSLTQSDIKDIRKNGVDSSQFSILFDERPKEEIMKSLQTVLFKLREKNRRAH